MIVDFAVVWFFASVLAVAVPACLAVGIGWGRDQQRRVDADLYDRELHLALQLRDMAWRDALNAPQPALFDWADEVDG